MTPQFFPRDILETKILRIISFWSNTMQLIIACCHLLDKHNKTKENQESKKIQDPRTTGI
jgi:hypothetical protein